MKTLAVEIVTREHVETYRQDGVVCIRNLISQTWISRLRESVHYALRHVADSPNARDIAAEGGKSGRFHNESALWQNRPGFADFIRQSPIAEAAAILMGSTTVRLYNDHLLVKEGGTDAPTPWHQDGTYFRVHGDQVISVWLGLDPVTRESGAMSFVKGSHRAGKAYRPVGFATGRTKDSDLFDGDMPDVDARPDLYETICYEMAPGDVTFHHALTIHGSLGNSFRDRSRRGYSVRMMGDDARYADRPWTSYVIGQGLADGAEIEGHPDFPRLYPAVSQS